MRNREADGATHQKLAVFVAVCTYQRNEPLRALLDALLVCQSHSGELVDLGVVVVDDNVDGRALEVVSSYEHAFTLGLRYRQLGSGNISMGRNLGIATALEPGSVPVDWIAMTDDDCIPAPGWITAYANAAGTVGAEVFTGFCSLEAPPSAPRWLTEQPFLDDARILGENLQLCETAATNNSFINAAMLRRPNAPRFLEHLGVIGGEDMVFFGTLHDSGVEMRFVTGATVAGQEPESRTTFSYVMRARYWLGNTETITNIELGRASKGRLALRACRVGLSSLWRPVGRLTQGKSPQFMYAFGSVLRAVGMLLGVVGARIKHH